MKWRRARPQPEQRDNPWARVAALAEQIADNVEACTMSLRKTFDGGPVTRVQTDNGSHIEPPLDQSWSHLDKLRWHAAVVEADTGLTGIRIRLGGYFIDGVEVPDHYGISTPRSSHSSMSYAHAWTYLNGMHHGARAAVAEPLESP